MISTRSRNVTDLSARLLLGGIFIWAAAWHLLHWKATVAMLIKHPLLVRWIAGETVMTAAQGLLVVAVAVMFIGGMSVTLGFRARLGSFLLIVFLVIVTPVCHHFWTLDKGAVEYQLAMLQFLKNLGLIGGLLLIRNRTGRMWSIDRLWR